MTTSIASLRRVGCADPRQNAARRRRDSRPLVVLLHALAFDHTMWGAVRKELSPKWRVITPDLWLDTQEVVTLDQQVDRLAEQVRGYGTPAWVVGTSYGGVVAQLLALRHPSLVRGLVLIATFADAPPGVFEQRAASAMDAAATLARWFGDSVDRTGYYVGCAARRLARVGPDQWRTAWRELAGVHLLAELPAIAAPCLVVVGELDTSTPPAMAEQIASHMPGAALQTVPGGHHLLVLERPDYVAEMVSEWVLTQEGSG